MKLYDEEISEIIIRYQNGREEYIEVHGKVSRFEYTVVIEQEKDEDC